MSSGRTWIATLGTAAALVLASTPLVAQQPDPPRFSVSAGAGVAPQLHGDYDFTAVAWQADARYDISRHFAIGVFFEEWRQAEEDVRTGVTLHGPSGPIGRADRIEQRTDYSERTIGWNLLGRVPAGRLTLTGGGGVSYLAYRRDHSTTFFGCTASTPGTCDRPAGSSRFTNSAFGVQGQAGADVAITRFISATAVFRAIAPVEDPGAGHLSFTAGARLVF